MIFQPWGWLKRKTLSGCARVSVRESEDKNLDQQVEQLGRARWAIFEPRRPAWPADGDKASGPRYLADSCIKSHVVNAQGTSLAADMPGGLNMAAAIPSDLLRLYWKAVQLAQKLAYI